MLISIGTLTLTAVIRARKSFLNDDNDDDD